MTLKIEIYEDTPEKAREAMLGLLGLVRHGQPTNIVYGSSQPEFSVADSPETIASAIKASRPTVPPEARAIAEEMAEPDAPQRERGKPSPGKARRTKEEIADVAERTAGEQAAISTGENRAAPDDEPEDDAATAEQDAADEAAEVAATRADGKLTLDDLRRAAGAYSKKFNMAAATALFEPGGLVGKPMVEVTEDELPDVIAKITAAMSVSAADKTDEKEVEIIEPEAKLTRDDVKALMMKYMQTYGETAVQEDGPKVFKSALGIVPDGTKNAKGVAVTDWVLSAIPDDQDSLKKCVTWWKSALTQAPESFGRKAVS